MSFALRVVLDTNVVLSALLFAQGRLVALRQAWFTGLTGLPFYVPLALVGVHAQAFAISMAVSLLYQFWIHTELVGKLGFLESFLNTPSHHRVHHATNPEKCIPKTSATASRSPTVANCPM